jgi:hypothetical protein
MDWLNYHHLLYFWMVAREGSVTRACERLHLAQPTVSTQLRQLEKRVGARLFERQGRNLVLTETGRLVLEYADGRARDEPDTDEPDTDEPDTRRVRDESETSQRDEPETSQRDEPETSQRDEPETSQRDEPDTHTSLDTPRPALVHRRPSLPSRVNLRCPRGQSCQPVRAKRSSVRTRWVSIIASPVACGGRFCAGRIRSPAGASSIVRGGSKSD